MTVIAPYSLRALKGAPIATPVEWEELNNHALHPQSSHLLNIFQHLGKKTNPWKNFTKCNLNLDLEALFK